MQEFTDYSTLFEMPIEKVNLQDFDTYLVLLELHKKKTKSNDETRASTSNTEN